MNNVENSLIYCLHLKKTQSPPENKYLPLQTMIWNIALYCITKVWSTASIVITHIENWTDPTGEQKRGSLKGSSTHKTLPFFVHRFMIHREGGGGSYKTTNSIAHFCHILTVPKHSIRARTLPKQKWIFTEGGSECPSRKSWDPSWGEASNQLTRLDSLGLYCTLLSHEKTNLKIQNCSTFLL